MNKKNELNKKEENLIFSGDIILTELNINSSTVKSIKPRLKRTHYRAIINWLTKYYPPPSATNLEKVKGFLETFYHLCGAEDWERVSQLFIKPLNSSSQSQLYWLLHLWGYYHEQLKLCEQLKDKTSLEINSACYGGIGMAYSGLSNYKLLRSLIV